MQHKFTFNVGNELLAGQMISDNLQSTPELLFLHGAGTSNQYRAQYLAEKLAAQNISSLTFDFSGHGESSGEMSHSSLEKRTQEALAAAIYTTHEKGLTLVGSSMGGHIALNLLDQLVVKNVILFCPAVYPENAYRTNFGPQFTKLITVKNAWETSSIFSRLEKYTGKLLVVIGVDDDVIPKGVIDGIMSHAKNVSYKKLIRLPGVDHKMHGYLSKHPAVADKMVSEIVTLMN